MLFPPAALAVISNNAVPGDATYPIKRALEDIIFAVASINPTSKAWFSAARSDRRFTEVKTLLAQGKKGTDALNELVEQTNIAASQIAQVSDPIEKAKLVEQLSTSIEKYDQGLQQVTTVSPTPQPEVTALPKVAVLPSTRPTNQPTPHPTLQPTTTTAPLPTSKPTPLPDGGQTTNAHSSPTPAAIAQTTPIPTHQPTVTPVPSRREDGEKQKDIEDAREKLKEIKDKLRASSQNDDNHTDKRNRKVENEDGNRKKNNKSSKKD